MKSKFLLIAALAAMSGSFLYAAPKISSPNEICKALLNPTRRGISLNRNFSDPLPESFYRKLPYGREPLANILSRLPFSRELIEDLPILLEFDWKSINARADTEIISPYKNRLIIELDGRGLFDLKFVASMDLTADAIFFEHTIQKLQKCGGQALLFASPHFTPAQPDEGFDLWITRLDGGDPKTRACLQAILQSYRGV
jgi:hypothetical protein